MVVVPAIDIRDGNCVRLAQGDYSQEKIYDTDPASVARDFQNAGATVLHVVDLDGARAGRPINTASFKRILQAVSIPVQVGGGIRTQGDIETLLELGVTRVVIGTKLVEDPAWAERIFATFRDSVIAGIDARNGLVAISGWEQQSTVSAADLAVQMQRMGATRIILTDIARDGMLNGPNLNLLKEVTERVLIPVVHSGGIGSLEDIRSLKNTKAEGVILGRALYEGKFKLQDALRAAFE